MRRSAIISRNQTPAFAEAYVENRNILYHEMGIVEANC